MAALLLTQAMTSMLVGIKPTDPLTFSAMAAFFLLIAALATWIPARRAAGLHPSRRCGRSSVSALASFIRKMWGSPSGAAAGLPRARIYVPRHNLTHSC